MTQSRTSAQMSEDMRRYWRRRRARESQTKPEMTSAECDEAFRTGRVHMVDLDGNPITPPTGNHPGRIINLNSALARDLAEIAAELEGR